MTVESANDRATMLADFGSDCTFSPGNTWPHRNDQSAEIKGIFDNEFYELIGETARTRSSQPMLLCRTADTSNAVHNSMLEIGADRYKIVGVEPDGTGITLLLLEGPK